MEAALFHGYYVLTLFMQQKAQLGYPLWCLDCLNVLYHYMVVFMQSMFWYVDGMISSYGSCINFLYSDAFYAFQLH